MKDRYALGPNIRHDAIRKTRSSGNYFVAVGDTEIDSNDLWKVKARHLWLRLTLNWLFSSLNVTFRQLEGKPFRTFVVYSEVVDSNIVGDQLHPLVHEVEYRGESKGVASFESLRIQWRPCQREFIDTVEVEVS